MSHVTSHADIDLGGCSIASGHQPGLCTRSPSNPELHMHHACTRTNIDRLASSGVRHHSLAAPASHTSYSPHVSIYTPSSGSIYCTRSFFIANTQHTWSSQTRAQTLFSFTNQAKLKRPACVECIVPSLTLQVSHRPARRTPFPLEVLLTPKLSGRVPPLVFFPSRLLTTVSSHPATQAKAGDHNGFLSLPPPAFSPVKRVADGLLLLKPTP